MTSGVAEKSVLKEPPPRQADVAEIGVQPNAAQIFSVRPPDRKFHVVWLCLAGSVVLLSMVMQIRNSQEVNVPFTQIPLPELCSFRRFTGMDCAGCGMTRCFISLGHGDLAGAWNYNPAGILLYAVVLFQLPFRAWQLWRIRRGLPEVHLGQFAYGAMILFAVLMVAQWGIKQAALFF